MRMTTRRRTSSKQPPTDPAPLLRAVAWPALLLEALRLPGLTLFVLLRLIARFTARMPELTGKSPTGRKAPADDRERHALAAYRRVTGWLDGGLSPTRPDMLPALALSAFAWGWMTWGRPTMWMLAGGVDAVGTYLTVMGVAQSRRDKTCTVGGLDANMRRLRVKWARKRLPMMGVLAGLGMLAGLVVWVFTGALFPCVMFAALLAAIPMMPAWRGNRKRFHVEYETALRLHAWWRSLTTPPVKGVPGPIRNVSRAQDGSLIATMSVGRENGTATDWVNDGTRRALTAAAQADGLMVAFCYDGDDRTKVRVAITPTQPPETTDLLADPLMLEARMTVDEARMGALYGAYPGRIRLTPVGSRDDQPCVYAVDVDGSNAGWSDIGRDWLKGDAGAFGAWMNGERLTVFADPSNQHGWVCADKQWDTVDWDMDKMGRAMTGNLGRTRDPVTYMRLIDDDKRMRRGFRAALDGTKLMEPATLEWAGLEHLQGDGWSMDTMTMTIPQSGGRQVTDYLKMDFRPAFGDAPLADVLPVDDDRQAVQTRRFRFVWATRAQAYRVPQALRDVHGDRPAQRMLARLLVSRACANQLKHPPLVGPARPVTRGRDTVWRMPIMLTGGVTAADCRRAQERLKTMMGADATVWRWVDSSRVILYAGGRLPEKSRDWTDTREKSLVDRLRLDEAWAAAKAMGADGRPVTTRSVEPYKGDMVKAVFDLPAGLGVDAALAKLDAFRATSGWAYTRRAPGDGLTLLMAHTDPLPTRMMADWTLMAADPTSSSLPFAVGDDGDTVSFDPTDTAHLLISGMTNSGKTSAAVTLANAALLHGWMLFVADPVKNANDFAPMRAKCSGFATGLDQATAMLDWVDREGQRRSRLLAEHGVPNTGLLPERVRPPRILVFVDEFNSLVELSKGMKRNPNHDPAIDNENMMDAWRDACRRRIGVAVSHILTQHRAHGITLILGSQQLSVGAMDAIPDAGTAKRQLGRLFIGKGDPAGNVAPQNVGEANRLIRQAGDMPKGRGLYERMGRGLKMVQCWWCGTPDMIGKHMTGIPDATPVDWSDLLPAPPRLVGVMDDDHVETVTVRDDDEWVVD